MIDPTMLTLSEKVKSHITTFLEENGQKNIKINIEPGSNIGDNFMGFIGKLTITTSDDKNQPKQFNWIIKTAPNLEMHQAGLNISSSYLRESYIYTDVLPTLHRFQIEKGVANPFCEHPKFVLSYLENFHESIVMENIKLKGYVMKCRQDPLDLNHVKLAMKTYAKLHAVSFALKDQKPDVFKKLAENTVDIVKIAISNEGVRQIQAMGLQFAFSVLDPKTDGNVLIAYKKFFDNYLDVIIKLLEDTNERAVIGHGDCWVNNFLWKYDLPDSKIPTNVCLMDWQMSRCGSLAFDLSYFMFTSTTKEFRDEHFDRMIKLYYYTLCSQIIEMGSDPEKLLPLEALQDELKKYSLVGMFMAIPLLAVITRDFTVAQLPEIKAEDMKDMNISVDMQKQWLMAGVNIEAYSKRVRDVIIDAYEKGYFQKLF
ncbi:uncharacterized protein [Onthophagus taurus]|uniref:uncharacterized protein n=1 Tax=Onthophagus taurus TaxID=166361 RepID=UPI0039BE1191